MGPAARPDTVIQLTHIGKSYYIGKHQEVPVLTDINLTVTKGEFVSIMGPPARGNPPS